MCSKKEKVIVKQCTAFQNVKNAIKPLCYLVRYILPKNYFEEAK